MKIKVPILLALAPLVAGCGLFTDDATRFRSALEGHASQALGQSSPVTFEYTPSEWPEGCGNDYALQVIPVSSPTSTTDGFILAGCKGEDGKFNFRYSTGLDLEFTIFQRFEIQHKRGAPTVVILKKYGTKVRLVQLR